MNEQDKTTNKLTDKAFSRLMITSLLGILVCITCLCSATWAWFSADTASGSNTLGSGSFGLVVTVTDANGVGVPVTERADGASVCTLGDAASYTVTLEMTHDTTVTKGFCTVKAANNAYQTAAIFREDLTPFTFKIEPTEPNMTLTFTPTWGLPANVAVDRDGTLSVGAPAGSED